MFTSIQYIFITWCTTKRIYTYFKGRFDATFIAEHSMLNELETEQRNVTMEWIPILFSGF